jgi:hypothetical protein
MVREEGALLRWTSQLGAVVRMKRQWVEETRKKERKKEKEKKESQTELVEQGYVQHRE